MQKLHKWWKDRPSERYWLEVTRRPDIGENLKAPQMNERGDEFWSYSLLNEVNDGDVVYHYDGITQAIAARSLATGAVWEDELIWAARGLSARSAGIQARPGWYLGLEHYERLPVTVSLENIRARAEDVRQLKASLTAEVGEPLYFPFEISDRRPIRTMQGYLFKLPRAFVELLRLEPSRPSTPPSVTPPVDQRFGTAYRKADEESAQAERDPFAVDPALVERGVRGHAFTQNLLAEQLISIGIAPLSPAPDEPNFDIAWRVGDGVFVAEIKSLTDKNEEKQLRLGLGQVLRYAHLLGPEAKPALVAERRPSDPSWSALCHQLGVLLLWPEIFVENVHA